MYESGGIPAQNNIEFELICRLRSSSGINVVIDISSLVWASHLRTIIFLTYPVQYKKFPFYFSPTSLPHVWEQIF